MTSTPKNKISEWHILALAICLFFADSPAQATPAKQVVSVPGTSFQLAQVKTPTTPDLYTAWNLEQAQAWFAKHPFFKAPPKVETRMQPSIFSSQEIATGQALNLQISFQNKTAKTPDFIQLWLVQNNPNYPLKEQRFLLPNIWQQDSTQAQQFLASALGQTLADDFKQAVLVKEEKGGEYETQETFFQGKHFVYCVMTQYDEDGAYREGEKGYKPYQTFFVIYRANFLAQ
ncbi:MAG: hypothetical protein AB7I41_07655 [Candidatus Sericytochromatia bacterium]